MAIQVKVLECTTGTSTGNRAFTGAGFQPQVVLFFGTMQTAWGADQGISDWCFGAATASTERWCVNWTATDNSTDVNGQAISNNRVIWWNLVSYADFVSMDADGFTLDIPQSWGSSYLFQAVCIAGLTDVYAGIVDLAQATGNVATTAPGFQPDLLITSMPSWARGGAYNTTFSAGGFGIGATDGTTTYCTNVKTHYRSSLANNNHHLRDKLWSCTAWNADTLVSVGSLVSFDTNGFTLNRETNGVDGLDRNFPYVAFKTGGQAKVGTFTSQTGTGNFEVTPGFNPKFLMAHTTFQTTSAQTAPSNGDGEWAFGISDGTSHWSFSAFSKGGITPIDVGSITGTTNFLTNYDRTAADTFAQEGAITVSSLTSPSNGFTLNQTDADASAYLVSYIAFGESPPSGTTYYLLSTATGDGWGDVQTGGSAPSTATTATGWTVGTTASGNYSKMAFGSERAAGTFSGTAVPGTAPDNSLKDAYRIGPLTGAFAAGNWTVSVPVIAVDSAGGQDGRVRVRVFKSANADGSSSTEVTSGAVQLSTVTDLTTGAAQISTGTLALGAITLSSEYLFFCFAWEITGAAT